MLRNYARNKLIHAIVYFARNTRSPGKIKLIKLLYLLDFEHFRLTGRSVTELEYAAWKFGPVPVSLYQEWDEPAPDFEQAIEIRPERVIDHVRETAVPRVEFDSSHFTKRELRLMEQLAAKYREANSPNMIDVTHAENSAWDKVWNNGEGLNRPIPYDLAVPDGDPNREAILAAAREYRAVTAAQRH